MTSKGKKRIDLKPLKLKTSPVSKDKSSSTEAKNFSGPKFKFNDDNSSDNDSSVPLTGQQLLLKKLLIVFEGDSKLANYVASLKIGDIASKNDNNNLESLFVLDRMDEIYDLYFLYKEKGRDGVINYVDQLVKLRNNLISTGEKLDYSIVIFDSPLLEDQQLKQKIKDELLIQKRKIIEGDRKCDKCGSNKFYQLPPLQLRRADEGMTTLFSCANCGKGGREG